MQEKMKDIKRELIEKGKKKGVLTFKGNGNGGCPPISLSRGSV